MSQSFRHDHPTTCALVSKPHTLEHRVEEWAEAKLWQLAEVNAVVGNGHQEDREGRLDRQRERAGVV